MQDVIALICARGDFRLGIRKNFYCDRVVSHWHSLHSEVLESPSLEVFKKCGDVAQRDMVSGHGRDGSIVALDDHSGHF